MADTRAGIAPQVDTYANWVSADPTLGKNDSGDSFNQMIFATGSPVGDILIWGNAQTFTASYAAGQYIVMGASGNATLETYTTNNGDWLLNEIAGAATADWTNVHLGDDGTQDSNVNHGLNSPLADLIIKLFVSTDGTDANSFEVGTMARAVSGVPEGYTVYEIDSNNIQIQTGTSGLSYISTTGTIVVLAAQNYYYKIKVYKLT